MNDQPSLQIQLFVYKFITQNSKQRGKFEDSGGLSNLVYILAYVSEKADGKDWMIL